MLRRLIVPAIAQWSQLSRPIQIAIQEALTGAKPPADALRDAAAKIKPVLDRTPL